MRRGGGGRRRAAGSKRKTRTPHSDVGKKQLITCDFLKKNKCLRLDLQTSLANPRSAYVMKPAAHMTWADEDFIGRISRISRRTHVLTAPARSIDRALGHYRRQWSEMFGPSYLDHLDLVPEDPA